MASVDTAAWWVEYVLRHDTMHLKSPSMESRWWQKRLLDVWLIVFTIFLILIVATYKIVKFVMYLVAQQLSNRNRLKVKKLL